jgi:hypothetical protein
LELRLFLNTPIIIILKRFCFLLREDWKIFSSPSEMYLRFFFSFSQCAATAAAIAEVNNFSTKRVFQEMNLPTPALIMKWN